jgi:hypothetical protein
MSNAQVIVRENFRKTRGNLGGKDRLTRANVHHLKHGRDVTPGYAAKIRKEFLL